MASETAAHRVRGRPRRHRRNVGRGERSGSSPSVRTGLYGIQLRELTSTAGVDLRCLVSGQVTGVGGRSLTLPFEKFSSAIHDVRYRLSWGLLIEAIETGERALTPHRWEQIGRKRVTSSQMQMWSARRRALRRIVRTGLNDVERYRNSGSAT
jgi:hypothetical protein